MLRIEDVRGAVARGWCSKDTANLIMNSTLAEAISQEVFKAIKHAGTVGYCVACGHPICIHSRQRIEPMDPQR